MTETHRKPGLLECPNWWADRAAERWPKIEFWLYWADPALEFWRWPRWARRLVVLAAPVFFPAWLAAVVAVVVLAVLCWIIFGPIGCLIRLWRS